MKELMELKAEICSVLKEDISNTERQKIGELFTLVDALLLNKLGKVNSKDYNSLYKDLMNKIVKNPDNADARVVLDRVKNLDVSEESFVYLKLLQIKIILGGCGNTKKVVELVDKLNNRMNGDSNELNEQK